jgi:hypothetical protein
MRANCSGSAGVTLGFQRAPDDDRLHNDRRCMTTWVGAQPVPRRIDSGIVGRGAAVALIERLVVSMMAPAVPLRHHCGR